FTGADRHHYARIGLRQILGRRLLLAQRPGRGHLGLCWTRYFHYHGEHLGIDQSGGHHHLHSQEKVHHAGHQPRGKGLRANEGCSQSRAAVAAYSRINVAVRRLGALLHGHGLHLHHPQLPAGRHRRQHLSTNAHVQLIVKNNFLSKFCLKKNKNKLELNN
ncbi:unnamed protein product, partial [Tetraodon nigroviridis]